MSLSENSGPGFISGTQNAVSGQVSEFLPTLNEVPREAFKSQQALNWWENFEDPFLNFLVAETLQKSFDMRRALTNVEQAEALLRGVQADLVPSINLSGDGLAVDYSDFGAGAGLGGDWNLDLFGRTRQGVKEAQSNIAANQALVSDTRRLVLTRMVQTYVAYRTTEARVTLNQSNLARLQEKRGRIDRLVQSGYSSRLDLDRADTQISQIESNLAALDAQKSSLRNALAIFMQQTPRALDANLSRPNSLSLPTQVAPPNLDYIVRHRPDIRAAEWGLVSATHGERAAQLALYPDVSLNGSIFNFSSLTNIGSLTSSIVASITQPLFGRGRLLAGVDLETARVKQALLNYEEAVFQAALEIDTTLTTWDRRQKQLSFDEKTLNTAIEAQKRAQKLFFAGQESFTAVIVAENTRLAAEESYLLSRQAAFNSYINYAAATVPNW
jgi:NodT family efflux transporter outer membrane factor (OMF) lipoprotein